MFTKIILKPDILDDDKIDDKDKLIIQLSQHYQKIMSREELEKNGFGWSNGIGDRFMRGKYNFTVIYKNGTKRRYCEWNEINEIPENEFQSFLQNNKKRKMGIIGIFIHSLKSEKLNNRMIRNDISIECKKLSCVVCGTKSDLCCDHKNDLYNDEKVLNVTTQVKSDFQPLCRHCNLQKREISNKEKREKKLYSAKNIQTYRCYNFEFPWEKKAYDENDIHCKEDTFWYDPIEFNNKIYLYIQYVLPILRDIKQIIPLKYKTCTPKACGFKSSMV